MMTITAGDWTYNLRPESYWHLTPAHGGFVLNNAYFGQGICWSISAVRRSPGMGGAGTTYGIPMNIDKENAWERVRETVDKNLPTRQHAFFLFDDKAVADRFCQTWFPGEDRLLLDARIDVNALIHRGDSQWLWVIDRTSVNRRRPNWPVLAPLLPARAQGRNFAHFGLFLAKRPKLLPSEVVGKVKAAGYPAFNMHDHTLLAKQLEARKPDKGYGVMVAKTWYWYENWFEKVIEKLAEGWTHP
jgi:hypothetical protein